MRDFQKATRMVIYKVESPLEKRFQRANKDFSTFLRMNSNYEAQLCGDNQIVLERVFYNHFDSAEEFIAQSLRPFDFADKGLVRPGWDKYFVQLAFHVAQRTNCMKRAVGCVLVKDKRIVSTGYNGTVVGMTNCGEGGCERCNTLVQGELETCVCIHAEENAVIEAGRKEASGSTAYITTFPCTGCAKKLI